MAELISQDCGFAMFCLQTVDFSLRMRMIGYDWDFGKLGSSQVYIHLVGGLVAIFDIFPLILGIS